MGLTWFRRPIRGAAERPTRNAASGPSSTATSRKCAAPGTRTKKITSNSSGIKLDKEPTRRPIERRTREKKFVLVVFHLPRRGAGVFDDVTHGFQVRQDHEVLDTARLVAHQRRQIATRHLHTNAIEQALKFYRVMTFY